MYRLYEAQATLLRRRKRVTIFWSQITAGKGWITRGGVWGADRVYKETYRANIYGHSLHALISNGVIVTAVISGKGGYFVITGLKAPSSTVKGLCSWPGQMLLRLSTGRSTILLKSPVKLRRCIGAWSQNLGIVWQCFWPLCWLDGQLTVEREIKNLFALYVHSCFFRVFFVLFKMR